MIHAFVVGIGQSSLIFAKFIVSELPAILCYACTARQNLLR